jgi:hypothetical protein
MSGRSPIDSLRRLMPVADAEAATVFGEAGREELLAALTSLPVGPPARVRHAPRTRPRRALVLAFAVLAVLGMTAAAWAIFRSSAQETTSVQCLIDGSDAIIPSISGSPAHDCAVTWQRDTGTSAPPLAAYDNGHGGVTVIPRNETPQAGWTRLASGSQDVDLIQLQTSLDDYIGGLNSSCLDAAAATKLAEAKLAQFGFTGWTVTVRDASGTCVAADYVEPAKQTVTLIPTDVSNGPETTYQKLAAQLRPLTQNCQSLQAAAAAVRSAAGELGLSESARTYDLNVVSDDSLRCASIYETVGGTISVTVRGPSG